MAITKEAAQAAASAINGYLANWHNTASVYCGERVAALEGVEVTDGSMLWLVGFDSNSIPALLIETDHGGQVYLARSQSFFRSDLYPITESSQAAPACADQEVGVLV